MQTIEWNKKNEPNRRGFGSGMRRSGGVLFGGLAVVVVGISLHTPQQCHSD